MSVAMATWEDGIYKAQRSLLMLGRERIILNKVHGQRWCQSQKGVWSLEGALDCPRILTHSHIPK